MNKAYLLTGGNLGDREQYLATARSLINELCGTIVTASSLYETAAWGKTDQPSFLNQALELDTALNAKQLIRRILKVEKMMGRTRDEKYGPRLIDIDMLLFNNEKHNYGFLKIPHPEMHKRAFVLVPMMELDPEFEHPTLHTAMDMLYMDCDDQSDVVMLDA